MTDYELIEVACKNATKILDLDYNKVSDHLSLVRIYFGLSHMLGGNEELMRHWIKTHNKHLGYCPIDGIESDKTSDVLTYLEGNLFL
jgi:hypothetical protein